MKNLLPILIVVMIVAGCTPQAQQAVADQLTNDGGKMMPGSSKRATFSQMQGMMERGATSTHKVTYDMEAYEDGPMSQMTLYQKGADKLRFDIVSDGQESRGYRVGPVSQMCTMADGSWQCIKITDDDIRSSTSQVNVEVSENMVEDELYTFSADGNYLISGVSASCYKWTYMKSSQRFCLTPEGVLVYTQTIDEEGKIYEMKASAYSTQVSDADFEIPAGAKVTDLNQMQQDLQNQQTQPTDSGDGAGSCQEYCQSIEDPTERESCIASC